MEDHLNIFLEYIKQLKPKQQKQKNEQHFDKLITLYQNIFYYDKYTLKDLMNININNTLIIDNIFYFIMMNIGLLFPLKIEPKTNIQYQFIMHLLKYRIKYDNHNINKEYKITETDKLLNNNIIYARFIKAIIIEIRNETKRIEKYHVTNSYINDIICILYEFALISSFNGYFLIKQCQAISNLGNYYLIYHDFIFHTLPHLQLRNLIQLLCLLLCYSSKNDKVIINSLSPTAKAYRDKKKRINKYSLCLLSEKDKKFLNNRKFIEWLFLDIIYNMDDSPFIYSLTESLKDLMIHLSYEHKIFSKHIYDILCFHLDSVHILHLHKIFYLIEHWLNISDLIKPFRYRLSYNKNDNGLFRQIVSKHIKNNGNNSPLKGFMIMFFILDLFCRYPFYYSIIGKECFNDDNFSWKQWIQQFIMYWSSDRQILQKSIYGNLEMSSYAQQNCQRFAKRMKDIFECSKYCPDIRELLYFKNEINNLTNLNCILRNGTINECELKTIISYNMRCSYIPNDVVIIIKDYIYLSQYSKEKKKNNIHYRYRHLKLLDYCYINLNYCPSSQIHEFIPRINVNNISWILCQIVEFNDWSGEIKIIILNNSSYNNISCHIDDECNLITIQDLKNLKDRDQFINKNKLNQLILYHIVFFKSIIGINSHQHYYSQIDNNLGSISQINTRNTNILTKHQFDIANKIRKFSLKMNAINTTNKILNNDTLKADNLFMIQYVSQTKKSKVIKCEESYYLGIDNSLQTDKIEKNSFSIIKKKRVTKKKKKFNTKLNKYKFNIYDGEYFYPQKDPKLFYKYYRENKEDKKEDKDEDKEEEAEEDKDDMDLIMDTSILKCELVSNKKQITRSKQLRLSQQKYLNSFVYDFRKNKKKHSRFGSRGRGSGRIDVEQITRAKSKKFM